jgi:Ner family transcriptional regulator
MSVVASLKKSPGADWHRAFIVASIHEKGWTLRKLSLAHGLSAGTLKSALDAPYLKAEKIIAAAIGIAPEQIWPTRYAKRNFTPILSLETTSDFLCFAQ